MPAIIPSAWPVWTLLIAASKPGLVTSTVKPWSLAIALISSMSIPVYWLLSSWKTKGAKDESLAMMYLSFVGVAFWPAGVEVSGTAESELPLEAVHLLMISSRLPSSFICAKASLNSVTRCSCLLPFLTPKAKLPTASPFIEIFRFWPWLMAYSMTGWSSITASTSPAERLLYIKSPVSKVLRVKPYLSLFFSRKRWAAVPVLTPTFFPFSCSYLLMVFALVVAITTLVS